MTSMLLLTEVQYIPTQWREIILEFAKTHSEYWNTLESMYLSETTIYKGDVEIYPPKEHIFRCFHFFEPEATQVVLMGQDPYHGTGQATGLCFGVPKNSKIPPSLRNISKEVENDLGKKLESTSLENWAKQGVLMLNTSLTVRQGNASSHMKYWIPFTKYIIEYISNHYPHIVYVIWGAFAHRQVESIIDWEKNHLVISSHPSPLSASKPYKQYPPFMGSRPFSQVNKSVKKKINWI